MDDIILYHNPACGTSRNTLALIRAAGIEPVIIEYLKTPPSRQDIRALALASGQPLRALLREKDTPYAALGLSDPGLTDDQLLDLGHQMPGIDHHAVADDRQLATAHDARRQERQLVDRVADDQRMARIVPALEPRDHVGPFGQPVDQLALALIAPLGTHHDDVGHAHFPESSSKPRGV